MSLQAGHKLGPYELGEAIGAGGMGEVYRARDTRLDRTVAIKVLPAHLADSPELRQRFEREARAISSLNHPHICSLYDVGYQDGVSFLVMEYLEGETLAQRLERGAMPLSDVLKYAVQIADALDKAHRQGVVHRDLKPGNIMLTPSGAKLMDFGLAKSSLALASVSSLTAPAHVTSPITTKGMIVGTFQYMSPEQVEGKEVDARSDLFAFGAVLYEMLTGRRAFQGKSQLSVASAILEKEPEPISALQPMTPPALDRTIRKCLAKDPEDRWQTARDLQLELKWIAESGSQAGAPAVVIAGRKQRELLAWIAAAAFALLAVAFAVGFVMRAPLPPRALSATILPPDKTNFVAAVVSPDGARLAFTARGTDGTLKLWVRSLDALSAQPLSGTDGATLPFWSADNRSLGFFTPDSKLKKIDASGGPPTTLCDVPGAARGGTWNREGVILFGIVGRNGIQRVSSAGGAATPVTKLDEARKDANHRWPVFLPDGRHFLYNVRTADRTEAQGESLYVGSLDGKVNKKLLPANFMVQYSSGHILFVRESTLMAQPFDAKRLELAGDAFPIAEQISTNAGFGFAALSASDNGVLAYRTGGGQVGSKLVWFDRQGKELGVLGDQALYINPKISANGQKVAVDISDPKIGPPDVWVYDVVRKLRTRLTFDPQADMVPVWSPDGTRVLFRSNRKGADDLYVKDASGAGNDDPLLESGEYKEPSSWSADGKFILFTSSGPKTRQDIWVLPLGGDRKPFVFLQTEYAESEAVFSPDGRWVAYRSNESGRDEIYVKPFPGPAGRWQVSVGGGTRPKWRRDEKEIFYLTDDDKIMSAEIRVKGAALEVGAVKALFQARPQRPGWLYDATGDGQRFLVNTTAVEQSASPVTLVVNWTAGLKK